MRTETIGVGVLSLTALLCGAGSVLAQTTAQVEIRLTLAPHVVDGPVSGRVFVMFDSDVYAQPMDRSRPSETNPWFAMEVEGWAPGSTLTLGEGAVGYPYEPSRLPSRNYVAQAVVDRNATALGISDEAGNIYSDVVAASIQADGGNLIQLTLDRVVARKTLCQTPFLREIRLRSDRLSRFHGWPVDLKAAVLLPPSYFREPHRRYATVYALPGFGSSYETLFGDDFHRRRFGMNLVGEEKVFIFLDQECPLGYHGYADSDNNGPWGTALVEEMIPHIEETYRVYREARTRFLMGHSSGGWAALWLQVTHPDRFGGAWGISPDPVDFRSFVGVDIYAQGANFYRTPAGEARELNLQMSAIDRVFGEGWAVSTFEAVHSPRDADGHPRRLWDRDTGTIDPTVADAWRRYDIRLVLQADRGALASRLAHRIHIRVAEDDPYGLGPPVRLLAETMADLGLPMDIVVIPGGGHDLWSDDLREQIHSWMDAAVRARGEASTEPVSH